MPIEAHQTVLAINAAAEGSAAVTPKQQQKNQREE